VVIEVVLVRPGPIQGGAVHPFLDRRQGKKLVTYPSPALKEALGPTLPCMTKYGDGLARRPGIPRSAWNCCPVDSRQV